MPDYKAMYFHLAGQVADAIDLLVKAQQEGEGLAMEEAAPPVDLAVVDSTRQADAQPPPTPVKGE